MPTPIPAVLQAALNKALPAAHFAVINRGIGGQDAPEELARLDTDAIAVHPQLVIWQVGANGAMRNADPSEFHRMVAEGVNRLLKAGIDVILMDNQRSPKVLAAVEHIILEDSLRGRRAGNRGEPVLAQPSDGRLVREGQARPVYRLRWPAP